MIARPGSHSTLLVIQHDENCPPAVLGDIADELGIVLDIRVTAVGDPVPDRLEADGLVVLGGDDYVRDAARLPHLRTEMDLLRSVHAMGRPALGICLGAQLAASALGGEAYEGEHGLELGWVRVEPTAAGRDDPVTAVLGDGDDLFLWHLDAIRPPPDAELLLTADRYPVQAFRAGSVWAVQSHPEVDRETVLEWCRAPGASGQLELAGVTPADLVQGMADRASGGRRLIEAWFRRLNG